MDEWIGKVADALKEAGTYENTDFVIICDHGQLNYSRYCYINLLLKQKSFLTADAEGTIPPWNVLWEELGQRYLNRTGFRPTAQKDKQESFTRLTGD